jgi:hypothetical protein
VWLGLRFRGFPMSVFHPKRTFGKCPLSTHCGHWALNGQRTDLAKHRASLTVL